MATLVDEKQYIKADPVKNNNKFWYIKLFDDSSTEVSYGRVGASGDTRSKTHTSMESAEKFFNKKCREKERGRNGEIPYQQIELINSGTTTSKDSSIDLKQIVESQINTDSDETKALIHYFINENIHTITSSTTITYDVDTGMFMTPCGAVTLDTIDKARTILEDIGESIELKEDLYSDTYSQLIGQYLMFIPHDVGRQLVAVDVISDLDQIKDEFDILDSLENTYKMIEAGKAVTDDSGEKVDTPKLFDASINILTDKKEIKRIKDFYTSTVDKSHACSHLKPTRIFKVEVASVNDAYVEGSKLGNIRELWHGSNVSNILSIMKAGLIIPPSSAGHCTGRMFGNGVYASDQSTKALNYAYGYWSGKRTSKCYMFLVDFAMGKEYNPNTYSRSLPKAGYDSTFAKGHQCGLRNNEMIVYNTNQVKLKYLVEFE